MSSNRASASSSSSNLNPLYSKLPPETLDVSERIGLSTGVVDDVTKSLLGSVRDIDKSLSNYYGLKQIEEKLHQSTSKSKRVSVKKTKKRLTCKERKKLFQLKSKKIDYSSLLPLYELWKEYICKVISSMKNASDLMKLVKCDYHGACVTVTSAKNPSLVGVTGIIIQETKMTIRLVSEKSNVLVVPKVGCVFAFQSPVDGKIYKVSGSNISLSPVLRSRAKLKSRRKGDEFL